MLEAYVLNILMKVQQHYPRRKLDSFLEQGVGLSTTLATLAQYLWSQAVFCNVGTTGLSRSIHLEQNACMLL